MYPISKKTLFNNVHPVNLYAIYNSVLNVSYISKKYYLILYTVNLYSINYSVLNVSYIQKNNI